MKTKHDVQNKLYLPLKLNGKKLEYMFETHGKIKTYRTTTALLRYSPDCDKIATYRMSSITDKIKLDKEEYSTDFHQKK